MEREKMSLNETNITKEEYETIENFLKSYKFCRRVLSLKNYEDKYFDTLEWESESPAEFSVARAKMFEVRHFILSMKNGNEKLMLYYHYVHGTSVDKCGELFGISRASAFRLKKRALARAYLHSVQIGKKLTPYGF